MMAGVSVFITIGALRRDDRPKASSEVLIIILAAGSFGLMFIDQMNDGGLYSLFGDGVARNVVKFYLSFLGLVLLVMTYGPYAVGSERRFNRIGNMGVGVAAVLVAIAAVLRSLFE